MGERRRGKGGRFVAAEKPPAEEAAADPEVAEQPARRVRPRFCRVYVRNRIAHDLPLIVDALLERAMEGSVPHIALMLKTAGFQEKGSLVPAVQRREKSLEQILLEQWEADRVRDAADAAALAALD